MRISGRNTRLVLSAGCLGVALALTGTAAASSAPAPVQVESPVQLAEAKLEFLRDTVAAARASQRRFGVPASVVTAQAILETGWGTSALARTAHNHFGMTCRDGRPGPYAMGCQDSPDRYCDDDGCRAGTASFRVYRSTADSFRDHGHQLATAERYAEAYAHRDDPDRFVLEMHRAGYATDPRYADSLKKIMRKFDLYRYDIA
jgi:flagellar protein FlgJ